MLTAKLYLIAGLAAAAMALGGAFWWSAKDAGRQEIIAQQNSENVETLERMRDANSAARADGPASNRLRGGAF